VTLIGRGVATINTGGEKVFPTEAEEAIRTHPGVDDALVLGLPDERFGEVVCALVVSQRNTTVEDLKATVRQSLASYKVPRIVRVVDEIPRMPNGKVDYPLARTLMSAG
jgi:fatty-acyl-CoA synthase